MTTLVEIEAAIQQLSELEARRLAAWLQDYLDDAWDRQIAADTAAGKLDGLIAQAEADIASGNVRDLDEILRDVWFLACLRQAITKVAETSKSSLQDMAWKSSASIIAL